MKYIYQLDELENPLQKYKLLGNKGAQLSEMMRIGLPVPKAFTITTQACTEYMKAKKWPSTLHEELIKNIDKTQKKTQKKLGDKNNPLLLSVRSGSYVSMPGMMDTVLNLGMNDQVVEAFSNKNMRGAWDSYRRFLQMFGDVVLGIKHAKFEKEIHKLKEKRNVKTDTQLTVDDLKELVNKYKAIIKTETGKPIPENPTEQLKLAVTAVFNSWNGKRAVAYRRLNNIPDTAGTAVNVQEMVFGNLGNTSATGVSFTRNPSTGQKEHYGEYLINAQGEDVVAGIRTPKKIDDMEKELKQPYKELLKVYHKLEKHYKDVQDFEFTIEEGKLYILQTRTGKRTSQAAIRIAVDMVEEKVIDKKTAILRVNPNQIEQVMHKQLDPKDKKGELAKGLPASPGAAVGQIVFNAEDTKKYHDTILVRTETSPEDIEGMHNSKGILTSRGGMTSHAAVVARGMGKCCVAGCEKAQIDEDKKIIKFPTQELKEGDWISLDGSTGEIFQGQIKQIEPKMSPEFEKLMAWADSYRKLKVRTNADNPKDTQIAIDFGAEGIGLCRTEHMFFEGERIKIMRQMILAEDLEGRKKALKKLLPFQKKDFKQIFQVLNGKPCNIRLIDPPLHEFLPHGDSAIAQVSKELNLDKEFVKSRVNALSEFNPMLGHRGCRLLVTYPEIAEMQTRAIIEAACELEKKGTNVIPEIMVPLVGHINELKAVKQVIKRTADKIISESGAKFTYKIGTMIEIPRAALTADMIAKQADFFSFGTNDLTQMTFGFSRDDAGKFLGEYYDKGILAWDPFQRIDECGVGQLVEIAAKKGLKENPKLHLGICGEHGGNPESIAFCHKTGLHYVSCSPYRVPVARLAAAHAALKE